MTECQGCGAWNDTRRTVCVLCGTSLAATDEWDATAELPPLPPLPDGGLRTSMPSWLREPPPPPSPSTPLPQHPTTPIIALGPAVDPRTFLSDDDFPQWLRDLAARQDETRRRVSERGDHPLFPPAASERLAPDGWTNWPGPIAPIPAPSESMPDASPAASVIGEPVLAAFPIAAGATALDDPPRTPDDRPSASVVAARAREERRGRDPWESLLLVLLVLGVLVAALWALVANGVFSPGL